MSLLGKGVGELLRNLKLAASSRTWMFGGAVSLSVLFTFGMVGGVDAASLADTVQFTIRTNPEVLQSAANRRAIDYELRQAKGLYFPQIDLRAGVGPEWSDNTSVNSTTLTRYESRATLQQRLFDGFETQSEKERQAARIDAAASRVREGPNSSGSTPLSSISACCGLRPSLARRRRTCRPTGVFWGPFRRASGADNRVSGTCTRRRPGWPMLRGT